MRACVPMPEQWPRNNNPMLMSAESLSVRENDPRDFLFSYTIIIKNITYNKILKYLQIKLLCLYMYNV